MGSEVPSFPPNVHRVYERFQQWRNAHTGVRLPFPERLWRAAELAWTQGVALCLNCGF